MEAAVQNATESDIQHLSSLFAKLKKCYHEKGHPNKFWETEQTMHTAVLEIIDNQLYHWVMDIILYNSFRYMLVLPRGEDVQKLSVDDWEDIIKAFKENNSHRAGTVIRAHLHYYFRAYEKYLKEHNLTDQEFVKLLYTT
jgi:DNA-binding GntR family transcriptional regulator